MKTASPPFCMTENHSLSAAERCSRYFCFSELFFAGETYEKCLPSNIPTQANSWQDYADLALNILDPLTERFGKPKITYGFSGPNLAKLIKNRISPDRDQHGASELWKNGLRMNPRGGAAVDIYWEKHNSIVVAIWIAKNLKFDRIYLYGDKSPLHVSFSKTPLCLIFFMQKKMESGFRIPQKVTIQILESKLDG